jgi:type I restriction enzyme S subunit
MGKFIYYYWQSPSFIDMFNDNKTGIIGGVSIAKVKEILIPLPPQREMNRIVAKIDEFIASTMSR